MHAFATGNSRRTAYSAMAASAVVVAVLANFLADRVGVPSWIVSAPGVGGAFVLLYRWFDQTGWTTAFATRTGLSTIPRIDGAYVGEVISTYDSEPLEVSITIEQTWTKLTVRLHVLGSDQTSDSSSMTAALDSTGHHRARLHYTYRSTVNPGVADADIDDHDGTATLDIDTQTGIATGRYYNARTRRGTIILQTQTTEQPRRE